VAALIASAAVDGDRVGRLVVDAALIALAANLANLFDRAPGRTLKVGGLCFVVLAVVAGLDRDLAGVAVAMGALLALLPADLGERLMIGDTGANPVGAVLALGLVLVVPFWGGRSPWSPCSTEPAQRAVSFSSIIDRVAPSGGSTAPAGRRGTLNSRDATGLQAHLRDRRCGQLPREGPHRFLARPAAEDAWPPGHHAEARPLHQRRPGHHEPVRARRVFVTDDKGETDLDLGHYERFIDENLGQGSNATTGSIYQAVLAAERRGDYLGKTVQVIPHITDEIKRRITNLANDDVDVVITEVGGTVGDIEILPFLEAIRQFRNDVGRSNVAYIHVTLVPFIGPSGEQKTKPTQHSVTELRSRASSLTSSCAAASSPSRPGSSARSPA